MLRNRALAVVLAVAALAAGCGGDGDASGDGRPLVVVSASLLGDVVGEVVGDQAEVEVLIPAGSDPHDFQLSARQVARLREADALVVNGGGFEAGIVDPLASAGADGIPTFTALDAVDRLGDDPHFFTDPARMAQAARALGDFLATSVDGIDAAAVRRDAEAYAERLEALDGGVADVLATVPPARRTLVTNHDVLGYLADRYGFEVVGVVVPGGATGGASSAGDLARLAAAIRDADVPAIFADTSAPDDLARTLAGEVGAVEVVPLFTESLGPEGSGADTYEGLIRTDARRIAEALGGGEP